MKKLLLATVLVIASFPAHAQTTQFGPWQIVNGTQEGSAWKLNTQTGESYYCYRFACYPQRQATPQEVQNILQQQRATQPQREQTQMKLLLIGIAALFLATGAAHAPGLIRCVR